MKEKKRFLVIACEILFREVCYCASLCKNIVDLRFLEKGLHDIGSDNMVKRLQEEIDETDSNKYDAILLVYALCNNGILGLGSQIPLIVPKAHDCITLLMGSKEEYKKYHQDNPFAYYMSSGWLERNSSVISKEGGIPTQLGINKTYQEYVDEYGEENAEYLMEILGDQTVNYSKYTFIDTNTGDVEQYKCDTITLAEEKGWEYEVVEGNVSILMDMMNGIWDESRFLILPPGKRIDVTYNEEIIKAK